MDNLDIAKACAKALDISVSDVYEQPSDPALAFRLESWLAERGIVFVNKDTVEFSPLTDAAWLSRPRLSEPYTTPTDRCAAVARIVARVLTQEET